MIDRSSGDRTAARGKLLRAASRAALAVAAAGIVAFAAHARTIGARLDRLAVVPGESPAAAPDPSSPGPFAPFAFGVVGPVRGDAAALERAVEALAAEGASFVVLVGDVTADDSAGAVRRLALAARDRGPEVVAVPGPCDLACADFSTFVCAPRWWFRHRDVLVVGVPGTRPEDQAWLRGRLTDAKPAQATFVISAEPRTIEGAAGTATVLGPDAGTRLVAVGADGITIREVPVRRGPPFDTWVRGAALAAAPFARTSAGHATALVLATLLLAAALVGRRAGPRTPGTTPAPSPV